MKFITYSCEYLGLLEKYFSNPNTPINNSSHKAFKTHLYDGDNGILGMLIDNDEIVAVSSALIIQEHGVLSCKYPHRLHIRQDYSYMSSRFMDCYWEKLLFDWLEQRNIENVYCTFNMDNPKAFMWAAKRHSRRIKNNTDINMFGKTILSRNWYIHKHAIIEMNTPQYLIYSSVNNDWFYSWRTNIDISSDMNEKLNTSFAHDLKRGWVI